MSEEKTRCGQCSAEMLAATAARTGGLCMPCSEGRRIDPKPPSTGQQPRRQVDALCIGIFRDQETADHADYFFEADVRDKDPRSKSRLMKVGTSRGLLRLHKSSGEMELLHPMPGDSNNQRFHSAAAKLKRHWQTGEIPKATQFVGG